MGEVRDKKSEVRQRNTAVQPVRLKQLFTYSRLIVYVPLIARKFQVAFIAWEARRPFALSKPPGSLQGGEGTDQDLVGNGLSGREGESAAVGLSGRPGL